MGRRKNRLEREHHGGETPSKRGEPAAGEQPKARSGLDLLRVVKDGAREVSQATQAF